MAKLSTIISSYFTVKAIFILVTIIIYVICVVHLFFNLSKTQQITLVKFVHSYKPIGIYRQYYTLSKRPSLKESWGIWQINSTKFANFEHNFS